MNRRTEYLRRPYARVLIPDDEGRYAAQILEFPGCYSEGGTPEEAYSNLEEAAQNWIESALAQGMAVPEPSVSQGYSGTISLRLPKSIHRRAAQLAHRDGVSLNQFLLTAIASRVGEQDLLAGFLSLLDRRLDRLQAPRTFVLKAVGVGALIEQAADTPADQLQPWRNIELSNLEGESQTPSVQTPKYELVHAKEG
jgi:predicted RNase H-like HicB family nuclease